MIPDGDDGQAREKSESERDVPVIGFRAVKRVFWASVM